MLRRFELWVWFLSRWACLMHSILIILMCSFCISRGFILWRKFCIWRASSNRLRLRSSSRIGTLISGVTLQGLSDGVRTRSPKLTHAQPTRCSHFLLNKAVSYQTDSATPTFGTSARDWEFWSLTSGPVRCVQADGEFHSGIDLAALQEWLWTASSSFTGSAYTWEGRSLAGSSIANLMWGIFEWWNASRWSVADSRVRPQICDLF